jgi:hypothetical protein
MNEEFNENNMMWYSSYLTDQECCYITEHAIPITDPPIIFYALYFFMFFLFCNHVFDRENIILIYLENKVKNYIKYSIDFYFNNEDSILDKNEEENDIEVSDFTPKRYEDKYLDEFNKLDMEFVLTESEIKLENEQFSIIKEKMEKELENNKMEIKDNLIKLECKYQNEEMEKDVENRIAIYLDEIEKTKKVLELVEMHIINDEDVKKKAREYVINERLNGLKNCIIIEKTPLGNVAMFYNNSRSSFEYYSDSTIPYRYLEVIGRKYVINYKCKQIYVDMSKEIEEAEKKLHEKKQKEDEIKRQEENAMSNNNNNNNNTSVESQQKSTKNVFAKFKTYNKDTNIKSAAVPLDRPAPVKQTVPQEEKVVKERANRYSFEGKIANLSFLKKIDRKVVDKRFALSFSEFKKMQKNK